MRSFASVQEFRDTLAADLADLLTAINSITRVRVGESDIPYRNPNAGILPTRVASHPELARYADWNRIPQGAPVTGHDYALMTIDRLATGEYALGDLAERS